MQLILARKEFVMRRYKLLVMIFVAAFIVVSSAGAAIGQDDDSTRNILKNGLLGAGTGAIASGVSGGTAGTGALVGAGTNVVGGALLDAMTAPSSSSSRSYRRAAPQTPDDYYVDENGDEYYYEEPPVRQESGTSKILKQGLLGAGTGALAAGVSGGDAGKGALIGAGTNVIGGALLDAITQPSQSQQPRRVYRRAAPRPAAATVQPRTSTSTSEEVVGSEGTRKKIIRKYDENGKVVSEEEIYY